MRRSRVRLLVAAPVLSEPIFVFDWPCGGECSRSSNELLSFGGIPERSKGSDCKSDGYAFEGSNPSPATIATTLIDENKVVCCEHRYAGMVQW